MTGKRMQARLTYHMYISCPTLYKLLEPHVSRVYSVAAP